MAIELVEHSDVYDLLRNGTLFGILKFTAEGGIARAMVNKTGAPSVKGTVVQASTTTSTAIETAPDGADEAVGVIYDTGVADGSLVWVVFTGVAQVLLKDTTGATAGNWVQTSSIAGRADATFTAPNPATHWGEIGHCLETVTAGSDKLVLVMLHFN